jgi:hypothetical protein
MRTHQPQLAGLSFPGGIPALPLSPAGRDEDTATAAAFREGGGRKDLAICSSPVFTCYQPIMA